MATNTAESAPDEDAIAAAAAEAEAANEAVEAKEAGAETAAEGDDLSKAVETLAQTNEAATTGAIFETAKKMGAPENMSYAEIAVWLGEKAEEAQQVADAESAKAEVGGEMNEFQKAEIAKRTQGEFIVSKFGNDEATETPLDTYKKLFNDLADEDIMSTESIYDIAEMEDQKKALEESMDLAGLSLNKLGRFSIKIPGHGGQFVKTEVANAMMEGLIANKDNPEGLQNVIEEINKYVGKEDEAPVVEAGEADDEEMEDHYKVMDAVSKDLKNYITHSTVGTPEGEGFLDVKLEALRLANQEAIKIDTADGTDLIGSEIVPASDQAEKDISITKAEAVVDDLTSKVRAYNDMGPLSEEQTKMMEDMVEQLSVAFYNLEEAKARPVEGDEKDGIETEAVMIEKKDLTPLQAKVDMLRAQLEIMSDTLDLSKESTDMLNKQLSELAEAQRELIKGKLENGELESFDSEADKKRAFITASTEVAMVRARLETKMSEDIEPDLLKKEVRQKLIELADAYYKLGEENFRPIKIPDTGDGGGGGTETTEEGGGGAETGEGGGGAEDGEGTGDGGGTEGEGDFVVETPDADAEADSMTTGPKVGEGGGDLVREAIAAETREEEDFSQEPSRLKRLGKKAWGWIKTRAVGFATFGMSENFQAKRFAEATDTEAGRLEDIMNQLEGLGPMAEEFRQQQAEKGIEVKSMTEIYAENAEIVEKEIAQSVKNLDDKLTRSKKMLKLIPAGPYRNQYGEKVMLMENRVKDFAERMREQYATEMNAAVATTEGRGDLESPEGVRASEVLVTKKEFRKEMRKSLDPSWWSRKVYGVVEKAVWMIGIRSLLSGGEAVAQGAEAAKGANAAEAAKAGNAAEAIVTAGDPTITTVPETIGRAMDSHVWGTCKNFAAEFGGNLNNEQLVEMSRIVSEANAVDVPVWDLAGGTQLHTQMPAQMIDMAKGLEYLKTIGVAK